MARLFRIAAPGPLAEGGVLPDGLQLSRLLPRLSNQNRHGVGESRS